MRDRGSSTLLAITAGLLLPYTLSRGRGISFQKRFSKEETLSPQLLYSLSVILENEASKENEKERSEHIGMHTRRDFLYDLQDLGTI